jgi:hypothetical protein
MIAVNCIIHREDGVVKAVSFIDATDGSQVEVPVTGVTFDQDANTPGELAVRMHGIRARFDEKDSA